MFHIIEGCNVDGFSASPPKCVRGVTHCAHRWRKKVCKKTHPPKIRVEKNNSQPMPSTNLFCLSYWERLPWMWPWTLGKMLAFLKWQLLWTWDFSLMYSCIHFLFYNFLDKHPNSIPQKTALQRSPNNFSGHKSCSFLWKKSRVGPRGPYRLKKTTGSAPKRILEVRTPRPAQVDVERVGVGWNFYCLKCWVGGFPLLRCLYFFVFFQIYPSILFILFFFFEDQLVKRWPRRKAWYSRTCAGSMWWWSRKTLSLRIWFKS